MVPETGGAVEVKGWTRPRWFVGYRVGDGQRESFKTATEPTQTSHGAVYSAVVGPFKTWRGADWMVKHPQSPLCTVWEFENAARADLKARAEAFVMGRPVRSSTGNMFF